MNIRAQTGLNYAKQRQIEDFVRSNRIDILHLQESHVEEDTFLDCNYISANYDIIANNSLNKFGTASLVKCDLEVKNVNMDQGGRVIIFDVGEHFTCGNFYLPCGSDRISRGKRENYCSEIIPNLLVNHKGIGICGGDFNCITSKSDATRNADAKMSPSLGSLISTFSWSDSFRHLHPSEKNFLKILYNGEARRRCHKNRPALPLGQHLCPGCLLSLSCFLRSHGTYRNLLASLSNGEDFESEV